MPIERIVIDNFKSFRRLDLPLNAHMNLAAVLCVPCGRRTGIAAADIHRSVSSAGAALASLRGKTDASIGPAGCGRRQAGEDYAQRQGAAVSAGPSEPSEPSEPLVLRRVAERVAK